MKLFQQLRDNQLAIISLLVALTALGYNTWRNELTEHNRNIRGAGFEMLMHVAELQRITYLAHYDKDPVAGNPRKGWTEVLVMQDLAQLMPESIQDRTSELTTQWQQNWERLGQEQSSVEAIDDALTALREEVLTVLHTLD